MAAPLLTLRDVVVRYGATAALDIASLDVIGGEVLAILGANGAGKSTLLRTLAVVQRLDHGRMEFPGLGATGNHLALRRRIAMVFQQPLLIDDSVYANVALGLRLRGCRRGEIEPRVMAWLERLAIGHLARRSARTLSGGEAQRASLARALVLEPDLLLLDEPFAALDPTSRESLLRDFQHIVKGAATTVVLVTHDRYEAYALGERIAIMDHGRLAQVGPREEVYARPASALVAATVGFENVLTARIEASDGANSTVAVGAQVLSIPGCYAVGSEVTLCIHADAVTVGNGAPRSSNLLRLTGKIRQRFIAKDGPRLAVDCGGMELIGVGNGSAELLEGERVTATLEPAAIHVIATASSR